MRRLFPPLFVAGLFLFAAVALALATPLWREEIAALARSGRAALPARLLSAGAATAAVLLVGVLAARLGLRRPWTAAALFAIFPAVLQAGAEAHLYAPALALSVGANCLAVLLRERATAPRAGAYALLLAGAAWMHPSAASVALAHCAWWIRDSRRSSLPAWALLVLLIALPAGGVLAADAWSDTRIAARQLLWVLPPVAILAASALETRRGAPLTASLAALCVLYSTRLYAPPPENWEVASHALSESARHGSCIATVPPEAMALYAFFHAELADWPCSGDRLLLAVAPSTPAHQRDAALASILAGGYAPESWGEAGGSELLVFGCVATAESPAAAARCHPPLR